MRGIFAILAIFFTVAAGAHGQTIVVDAAGGTGSHYRDLPQAIAAAQSGATLRVRPGSYSLFSFANKGLTIVGEERARVRVELGLVLPGPDIGPTAPADVVVLAHLTVICAEMRIRNARGPVILHDLDVMTVSSHSLSILGCDNVHVHRLTMAPGPATVSHPPPRLRVRSSQVVLAQSSIVGARSTASVFLTHQGGAALGLEWATSWVSGCALLGGAPDQTFGAPGHGGPGIVVDQRSTLLMFGGTATGGPGGQAIQASGGNGGDGLIVSTASRAWVDGSALAPGQPRQTGGQAGLATRVDATSALRWRQNARPPVAMLRGEPATSATVSVALDATPASPALLLIGADSVFVTATPVLGVFGVVPLLTAGPAVVDANGSLVFPLAIPATLPLLRPFSAQFVTVDAVTNEWMTANPVIVLALR